MTGYGPFPWQQLMPRTSDLIKEATRQLIRQTEAASAQNVYVNDIADPIPGQLAITQSPSDYLGAFGAASRPRPVAPQANPGGLDRPQAPAVAPFAVPHQAMLPEESGDTGLLMPGEAEKYGAAGIERQNVAERGPSALISPNQPKPNPLAPVTPGRWYQAGNASDEKRDPNADYVMGPRYQAAHPGVADVSSADARAQIPLSSNMGWQSRKGFVLENYPNLYKAAVQSGLSEDETYKVINLTLAVDAADKILSSINPDRATRLMETMPLPQRALVMDIITAQVNTAVQSNGQLDNASEVATAGVNPSLTVQAPALGKDQNPILQWANEKLWNPSIRLPGVSDQTNWGPIRGGELGIGFGGVVDTFNAANEEAMHFARAATLTPANNWNWSSTWDNTEAGRFDPEMIKVIKQNNNPKAVDVMLTIKVLATTGNEDPIGYLTNKYKDDPEAQNIADRILRNTDPNSYESKLANEIDAAETSNLGNIAEWSAASLFGASAGNYSDIEQLASSTGFRVGTKAINVGTTFLLDPTIAFAGATKAYRAATYGTRPSASLALFSSLRGARLDLAKLSSLNLDRVWLTRGVSNYFGALGRQLDEIRATQNAGDAAQKFNSLASQNRSWFSPESLRVMLDAGVKDVATAREFFDSGTNIEHLIAGQPAKRGHTFVIPHMTRATAEAKRLSLALRGLSRNALGSKNYLDSIFGEGTSAKVPSEAADHLAEVIEKDPKAVGRALGDFVYTDEGGAVRTLSGRIVDFITRTDREAVPEGVDPTQWNARDRYGWRRKGVVTGDVRASADRIGRLGAHMPDVSGGVPVAGDEGAALVKELAQAVNMPRYFANYLQFIWPAMSEPQRVRLINGINRTALYSSGVDLVNPALAENLNETFAAVASRKGTQYAPSYVDMIRIRAAAEREVAAQDRARKAQNRAMLKPAERETAIREEAVRQYDEFVASRAAEPEANAGAASATPTTPGDEVIEAPVADLEKLLDKGPRNEKDIAAIADELAGGGSIREPVIVAVNRRTGQAVISNGNHRVEAAIRAGSETVPVKIRELDIHNARDWVDAQGMDWLDMPAPEAPFAAPAQAVADSYDSPANRYIMGRDRSDFEEMFPGVYADGKFGNERGVLNFESLQKARMARLAEKRPDLVTLDEGSPVGWKITDGASYDDVQRAFVEEFFPGVKMDDEITLYRGMTQSGGTAEDIFQGADTGGVAYWTLSPSVANNFGTLPYSTQKIAVIRIKVRDLVKVGPGEGEGIFLPGWHAGAYPGEYAVTLNYTKLPEEVKASAKVVDANPNRELTRYEAGWQHTADDIFGGETPAPATAAEPTTAAPAAAAPLTDDDISDLVMEAMGYTDEGGPIDDAIESAIVAQEKDDLETAEMFLRQAFDLAEVEWPRGAAASADVAVVDETVVRSAEAAQKRNPATGLIEPAKGHYEYVFANGYHLWETEFPGSNKVMFGEKGTPNVIAWDRKTGTLRGGGADWDRMESAEVLYGKLLEAEAQGIFDLGKIPDVQALRDYWDDETFVPRTEDGVAMPVGQPAELAARMRADDPTILTVAGAHVLPVPTGRPDLPIGFVQGLDRGGEFTGYNTTIKSGKGSTAVQVTVRRGSEGEVIYKVVVDRPTGKPHDLTADIEWDEYGDVRNAAYGLRSKRNPEAESSYGPSNGYSKNRYVLLAKAIVQEAEKFDLPIRGQLADWLEQMGITDLRRDAPAWDFEDIYRRMSEDEVATAADWLLRRDPSLGEERPAPSGSMTRGPVTQQRSGRWSISHTNPNVRRLMAEYLGRVDDPIADTVGPRVVIRQWDGTPYREYPEKGLPRGGSVNGADIQDTFPHAVKWHAADRREVPGYQETVDGMDFVLRVPGEGRGITMDISRAGSFERKGWGNGAVSLFWNSDGSLNINSPSYNTATGSGVFNEAIHAQVRQLEAFATRMADEYGLDIDLPWAGYKPIRSVPEGPPSLDEGIDEITARLNDLDVLNRENYSSSVNDHLLRAKQALEKGDFAEARYGYDRAAQILRARTDEEIPFYTERPQVLPGSITAADPGNAEVVTTIEPTAQDAAAGVTGPIEVMYGLYPGTGEWAYMLTAPTSDLEKPIRIYWYEDGQYPLYGSPTGPLKDLHQHLLDRAAEWARERGMPVPQWGKIRNSRDAKPVREGWNSQDDAWYPGHEGPEPARLHDKYVPPTTFAPVPAAAPKAAPVIDDIVPWQAEAADEEEIAKFAPSGAPGRKTRNPTVALLRSLDDTLPSLHQAIPARDGLWLTDRYRLMRIDPADIEAQQIVAGRRLRVVRRKDVLERELASAIKSYGADSDLARRVEIEYQAALEGRTVAAIAESPGNPVNVDSILKAADKTAAEGKEFIPNRFIPSEDLGRAGKSPAMLSDGTFTVNAAFFRDFPKGTTFKYLDPEKPLVGLNAEGELIGLLMPVKRKGDDAPIPEGTIDHPIHGVQQGWRYTDGQGGTYYLYNKRTRSRNTYQSDAQAAADLTNHGWWLEYRTPAMGAGSPSQSMSVHWDENGVLDTQAGAIMTFGAIPSAEAQARIAALAKRLSDDHGLALEDVATAVETKPEVATTASMGAMMYSLPKGVYEEAVARGGLPTPASTTKTLAKVKLTAEEYDVLKGHVDELLAGVDDLPTPSAQTKARKEYRKALDKLEEAGRPATYQEKVDAAVAADPELGNVRVEPAVPAGSLASYPGNPPKAGSDVKAAATRARRYPTARIDTYVPADKPLKPGDVVEVEYPKNGFPYNVHIEKIRATHLFPVDPEDVTKGFYYRPDAHEEAIDRVAQAIFYYPGGAYSRDIIDALKKAGMTDDEIKAAGKDLFSTPDVERYRGTYSDFPAVTGEMPEKAADVVRQVERGEINGEFVDDEADVPTAAEAAPQGAAPATAQTVEAPRTYNDEINAQQDAAWAAADIAEDGTITVTAPSTYYSSDSGKTLTHALRPQGDNIVVRTQNEDGAWVEVTYEPSGRPGRPYDPVNARPGSSAWKSVGEGKASPKISRKVKDALRGNGWRILDDAELRGITKPEGRVSSPDDFAHMDRYPEGREDQPVLDRIDALRPLLTDSKADKEIAQWLDRAEESWVAAEGQGPGRNPEGRIRTSTAEKMWLKAHPGQELPAVGGTPVEAVVTPPPNPIPAPVAAEPEVIEGTVVAGGSGQPPRTPRPPEWANADDPDVPGLSKEEKARIRRDELRGRRQSAIENNDIRNPSALNDALGPSKDPRPTDNYALYDTQLTKRVSVVDPAKMNLLMARQGYLNIFLGQGAVPTTMTDFWTLATLAGPRFVMRSGLEDFALYALTGGQMFGAGGYLDGRRASTAIREATERVEPVNKQRIRGNNPGMKLSLATTTRREVGTALAKRVPAFRALVLPYLTEAEVAEATAEATAKGGARSRKQIADLAATAFARARFFSINRIKWAKNGRVELTPGSEAEYVSNVIKKGVELGYLNKNMDRASEVAEHLADGTMPAYKAGEGVETVGGVTISYTRVGVDPGKTRDAITGWDTHWQDSGRNADDVEAFHMELDRALHQSGLKGYLAISRARRYYRLRYNVEKSIKAETKAKHQAALDEFIDQFAEDISQDPNLDRYVLVQELGVHGYAKRLLDDGLRMMTTRDGYFNNELLDAMLLPNHRSVTISNELAEEIGFAGSSQSNVTTVVLNREQWNEAVNAAEGADRLSLMEAGEPEQIFTRTGSASDRKYGLYYFDADGKFRYNLDAEGLHNPDIAMPQSVGSANTITVPVPDKIPINDRAWSAMGRSLARLTREPIYISNYVDSVRIMEPFRAKRVDDLVAQGMDRSDAFDIAEKWMHEAASNRAYDLTMAYVDNPAIRSQLAWQVRNVARFYRALEDFYRRMLRVAQNDPVVFWKAALTFQVLDDSGFVWTDEYGDKYFLFPGTQAAQHAINAGLAKLGVQPFTPELPMTWGGKLLMLSPSTDPNALIPTLGSPFSSMGIKGVLRLFPSLGGMSPETSQAVEGALFGEYSPQQTFAASIVNDIAGPNIKRILDASVPLMGGGESRFAQSDTAFALAAKQSIHALAAAGVLDPTKDYSQEELSTIRHQADATALNILFLKAVMTPLLPATPNVASLTVSDEARAIGLDSMDAAFLATLPHYDSYGDALVAWTKNNPGKAIFTVSKYQNTTYWEQTQQTQQFIIDNRAEFDRRPEGLSYFSPTEGNYNGLNGFYFMRANGIKVPVTVEEYFNKTARSSADAEYAYINQVRKDMLVGADEDQVKLINETVAAMKRDVRSKYGLADFGDTLAMDNTKGAGRSAEEIVQTAQYMIDSGQDKDGRAQKFIEVHKVAQQIREAKAATAPGSAERTEVNNTWRTYVKNTATSLFGEGDDRAIRFLKIESTSLDITVEGL